MDLTGAIDLHVHSAPDIYARSVDDLQLVQEAEAAGMRAVLLKSHHTLTADRATLAAKHVDMNVFGGLVLNHTVGGLNPVAVETAIAFGARQIWMPTLHAAHCLDVAEAEMFRAEARKGRVGIRVIDNDGRILPEVMPILEQIRDADIALGTGHISPAESLVLLEAAANIGITKMLVTHPLMQFTRFEVDQMKAAAALGAILEFDYLSCCPNWHAAVPPKRTAEAIHAVGFDHCVIGTDGGQSYNPHPAVMMQDFAHALLAEGLPEQHIQALACKNPARIMGL